MYTFKIERDPRRDFSIFSSYKECMKIIQASVKLERFPGALTNRALNINNNIIHV